MPFVWRVLGRERKRFGLQRAVNIINLSVAAGLKHFKLDTEHAFNLKRKVAAAWNAVETARKRQDRREARAITLR